ncbi:ureidoglycolate hydrolase [Halioglobus sp. HI00S01]|uniref:ureidoglycolate lyase n=1 Tax=Halioglobus sp. HI00S01 TaxID=1822214 RepID=UPI0007C25675|nr:ureidoglycolate lyase [Halioglobus sp. HI00S01]KZX57091.1 ureidoglycolate hydrolase [Halioglobus sp. HI00S01]
MQTLSLTAKTLTRDAFSPYGDVIEISEDNEQFPINYGRTQRHHALATVQLQEANDSAIISVFCSQPIVLPFRAEVMERHPKGSQAFMPLGSSPYLVAVAPAGEFNPESVELFLARPDQGVNYHQGTWHHYSLALDTPSNFLVIDRQGSGENCDEVELSPPLEFRLEAPA